MTAQLPEVTANSTLYERDYCLWIQTTARQIREKNFEAVDWDNVLEELESLGKSDKRELRNRVTVLLEHLLKLAYWDSERLLNQRNWKGTIKEQRRQINFASPPAAFVYPLHRLVRLLAADLFVVCATVLLSYPFL